MKDRGTSGTPFGTFTVLDLMLFIVASSVSMLLMRQLRPAVPTPGDYLALSAFCGPAGLAVFGPWAVRRQFVEGDREELDAGEWLWIALGGTWLAATPLLVATAGKGIVVFSGMLAVFAAVTGFISLLQSLSRLRRRAWTHWAGIVVCVLHGAPVLVGWRI